LRANEATIEAIAATIGTLLAAGCIVMMLATPGLKRRERLGLAALIFGSVMLYQGHFSIAWTLSAVGTLIASEIWRRVALKKSHARANRPKAF